MTSKLALAATLLLLSTSAMAETVTEKTGINSALGIAPKTRDFVTEVATSDMTELAAAKISLQKGNANEKSFASMMIADHTKTSDELKALVASGATKAALPSALDSASQKKIDDLNSASAADFAAQYDPMQVKAHEDAVSLFQRYANGGHNLRLKEWAAKTLPALQHHLDMAKSLPNS